MVQPFSTEARESVKQERAASSVIAIAASAGAITAISQVLTPLSPKLAAAVLVVQHLDPHAPTMLAEILSRTCRLPVSIARDGEVIVSSHVYIAPPNRHLLVSANRRVHLTDTAALHYVRPSADALFESLPGAQFSKIVCVVLTGSGSDGAAGIVSVKKAGGTTIAQDRASSEHFGMPSASIRTGSVDHILALKDMPGVLTEMVGEE